jgi:hypothetical protein
MAVAKMEGEVREWLDRLAIQDVIHRYSDVLPLPLGAKQDNDTTGHVLRKRRL